MLQEYKTELDFASMVDSLLLNYTDKYVPFPVIGGQRLTFPCHSYIDSEFQCLVLLYSKELDNLRKVHRRLDSRHSTVLTTWYHQEAEVTVAKQGSALDKVFASTWNLQAAKRVCIRTFLLFARFLIPGA